MADTYYCPQCNQPMLPSKDEKIPNEYDHASGCPLSYAAVSLEKQLAAALRDKERLLEVLQEARDRLVMEGYHTEGTPEYAGVMQRIDAAMSSSQPPANEGEPQ